MSTRTPSMLQEYIEYHCSVPDRHPRMPKKALNSWMAFRAYYRRLFPDMQQKDASRHLTVLWQQDPFKAKWAVIAAAYSRIRDEVGKQSAPLGRYLSIVCPMMGIVDNMTYLSKLNWTRLAKDDGAFAWQQCWDPVLSTFGHDILYSTMTIDDIIQFCASLGYISQTALTALKTDPSKSNGWSKGSTSRQGLLISGPTMANPIYTSSETDRTNVPIASDNFTGTFPVTTNQQNIPLQWTGNMSEVYYPAVGSADFEQFIQSRQGPNTS